MPRSSCKWPIFAWKIKIFCEIAWKKSQFFENLPGKFNFLCEITWTNWNFRKFSWKNRIYFYSIHNPPDFQPDWRHCHNPFTISDPLTTSQSNLPYQSHLPYHTRHTYMQLIKIFTNRNEVLRSHRQVACIDFCNSLSFLIILFSSFSFFLLLALLLSLHLLLQRTMKQTPEINRNSSWHA